MVVDYEQMGVFYLGKHYELEKAACVQNDFLLYESRDLLTHAVCLGMTGSGKTGLCIDLLEEAAIDKIPVIAVDVKGDLSNLLLNFPSLDPQSFLPFVDEDLCRRQGLSPEQAAAAEASRWKNGLAQWQQDGTRIQLLAESAEFELYTPASSIGTPLSVLKSFAVPDPEIMEERDLLREQLSSTATSILALLDLEADPLKSREHILLASILDQSWKDGKSLDLHELIGEIQNPPLKQLGAIPLESFFPAKERYEFAMTLNNLLAAPGFEAWLEGEALDIDRLFYSDTGKNKVSIISIAHLSDTERMFFVSLLLTQLLSWMRKQSGTSSLRAVFYMDEILGYFPPVKNPPCKAPLITLLKQARAFGLGVVLATQNPVDLDYKALANTGSWFIGRMQTERDKMRVLDGLESAAAESGKGFDRKSMDRLISRLEKQVFLLNNVHQTQPVLFKSRWSLSYLKGPLSRSQLRNLKTKRKVRESESRPASAANDLFEPASEALSGDKQETKRGKTLTPVLSPDLCQRFAALGRSIPEGAELVYKPMIFASAALRFYNSKFAVDKLETISLLALIKDEPVQVNWQRAFQVSRFGIEQLRESPEDGIEFSVVPSAAVEPRNYKNWEKDLQQWLMESKCLELYACPFSKEISLAGESERDFRIRLQHASREKRDQMLADLQERYQKKLSTLESKLQRSRQLVEREMSQSKELEMNAAIDVGASLFQALVGRKLVSSSNISRIGSAARKAGRAGRQRQEVDSAINELQALEEKYAMLHREFESELSQLKSRLDPLSYELEKIKIDLKKSQVNVNRILFCWAPCIRQADGRITAAW